MKPSQTLKQSHFFIFIKVGIADKRNALKQTSAPIGAWKCNFPAFLGNNERPTKEPTKSTNRQTS